MTPERNAKYVPQQKIKWEEKRGREKTRTKRSISHKYLCVVENSISQPKSERKDSGIKQEKKITQHHQDIHTHTPKIKTKYKIPLKLQIVYPLTLFLACLFVCWLCFGLRQLLNSSKILGLVGITNLISVSHNFYGLFIDFFYHLQACLYYQIRSPALTRLVLSHGFSFTLSFFLCIGCVCVCVCQKITMSLFEFIQLILYLYDKYI